ncbi:hypothetical protein CPB84DRAFT_97496 [Gymnopilus junonius]|uniref:Uncharacterized protein n=1 Tax=Gymnopilus junonius TaxID=109634 RepID=A0A9P5TR66_GYMJU|nr:hypothetical protein CPB84DRAFT_97496 [Gymnopilus junonius]
MKSTSAPKYVGLNNIDRISEADHSENEQAGGRYSPIHIIASGDETEPEDEPPTSVEPSMVPLPSSIPSASHMTAARTRNQSGLSVNVNAVSLAQSGSRPRRSASLSEALKDSDDYQLQLQQQYQNPSSRPGTSLGTNAESTGGARRITTQQRERQDQELRAEYKKYLAQDEAERKYCNVFSSLTESRYFIKAESQRAMYRNPDNLPHLLTNNTCSRQGLLMATDDAIQIPCAVSFLRHQPSRLVPLPL